MNDALLSDQQHAQLLALLFDEQRREPTERQQCCGILQNLGYVELDGHYPRLTSEGRSAARLYRLSTDGLRRWNSRLRGVRYEGITKLGAMLGAAIYSQDEIIPDVDTSDFTLGQSDYPMHADYLLMLDHGQELNLAQFPVKLEPMMPRFCHFNVAELFRLGELDEVMTGYALDNVLGMWVQHTWGLKDSQLIETTSVRQRYFGVRLAPSADPHVLPGSLPHFVGQLT